MAKRTVYNFLKKKYPKNLVLFAKNNKIYKYEYDYYLYLKYNKLIKRSYKINCYDEAIVKYKLGNVLKKVGII